MKNYTVVVSAKHQITIPNELREALNIRPGCQMRWQAAGGVIQLTLDRPAADCRGLLAGLSDTAVSNDAERF